MIIKKTTIYELEQSGIILDEPCGNFIRDENRQEHDDVILQLIYEANQMQMEDPVKYFSVEDYYPIDVHQQDGNKM